MASEERRERAQPADAAADAYRARREALHRAVHDLDAELDALEAQAGPDAVRFREAMQRFLATLREHIVEAEAPDSLLAQIVDDAPWLTRRTELLKGEHGDLLERTNALIERAEASDDVAALLPDARELSERTSEHRHRATDLMMDAYMLDVPAGD